MMDAATACFLKRYYPHVIKWWLVAYNPEFFRVWPSKSEKEDALRIEAEKQQEAIAAQQDDADFNATTGSYSGAYGKGPVDDETKAALDAILNISSNQSNIDFLLAGGADGSDKADKGDVILPPEHDEIISEANAIYERLMREAAEDEARKQAEIEAVRLQTEMAG